ncbi:kinesin-like protein KIN-5C [Tanacetum coccineum]
MFFVPEDYSEICVRKRFSTRSTSYRIRFDFRTRRKGGDDNSLFTDHTLPTPVSWLGSHTSVIAAMAGACMPKVVLDVGCGVASFRASLLDRTGPILGVQPWRKQLQILIRVLQH